MPGNRFSSRSRISWKCDSGERRCDRVVERLRLLVERQPLAVEHPDARAQAPTADVPGTRAAVGPSRPPVRWTALTFSSAAEVSGSRADGGKVEFGGRGLGLPCRGTVVCINVVTVVLAEREHEPDVLFGGCVHRGRPGGFSAGPCRRLFGRDLARKPADGHRKSAPVTTATQARRQNCRMIIPAPQLTLGPATRSPRSLR